MHEIPDELTRGPFTLARAAELGLSVRVVSGSRFRTPWPGVRILRGAPDTLLERCRAAKLVLPESAVFTHGTALYLGDWLTPIPPTESPTYARREPHADTSVHVSVPLGTARPRGRGLVVHRWQPEPHDVIDLAGLRLSSGTRTWCDLGAAGAVMTDLVVLADALRRDIDPGGRVMDERLTRWHGRRGYRVLVEALASSRDGVDSPMETRLRLLLVGAGLPDPLVNEWVRDEYGAPLHRPDLSWPRWKVASTTTGGIIGSGTKMTRYELDRRPTGANARTSRGATFSGTTAGRTASSAVSTYCGAVTWPPNVCGCSFVGAARQSDRRVLPN